MDQLQLMIKILGAIKTCEDNGKLDMRMFSEKSLLATEEERDNVVCKMIKNRYVDGFYVIDGIDNYNGCKILWGESKPHITIEGLEYISNNRNINKIARTLLDNSFDVVSAAIAKGIMSLIGAL